MNEEQKYFMEKFSGLLQTEVNRTFQHGALFAAILGIASSFIIFTLEYLKLSHDFFIPGIWSFLCGAYALMIHFIAKKGKLNSSNQYFLILILISLPSLIYILAYFLLPAGTATYITGPPSYIYIFLIIMTGFLFDIKLAVFSGFIAGIEYFIIYLAGRHHLSLINCGDKVMLQDFTDPAMFFFKSMIMVFSGIVIGILSSNTKSLISKFLRQEHEKQTIDRLFGQYVSSEIKERIIAQKKGIIGEKKNIAILFSDIRSFTAMSEGMAPEKIVEQLNEYLDKMVMCVNSAGGVIDKFIGDAVMATFGGVLDLANPCEAALSAAISMRRELAELNEKWKAAGWPQFEIGIGIHFGEVLQGSIGSANRKEFTIIGDSVNTASRLESLTKEHKFHILLSGDVYKFLSDEYKKLAAGIGGVSVKGKTNKVDLYGINSF